MRAELAEATESLAMAKSLFARAAQANDLEEQLKARFEAICTHLAVLHRHRTAFLLWLLWQPTLSRAYRLFWDLSNAAGQCRPE